MLSIQIGKKLYIELPEDDLDALDFVLEVLVFFINRLSTPKVKNDE